jgi:hypothetical protein
MKAAVGQGRRIHPSTADNTLIKRCSIRPEAVNAHASVSLVKAVAQRAGKSAESWQRSSRRRRVLRDAHAMKIAGPAA